MKNSPAVLVIGLGSMGKRRIRCLQHLGVKAIAGFDSRPDRMQEAVSKYNIKTLEAITASALKEFDRVLISVPPDQHGHYMRLCTEVGCNYFVEASVIDEGLQDLGRNAEQRNIVAAPSATMLFHPAFKHISDAVKSGRLGKISNFIYHVGQYLPDWHTYEPVSDYYVSNPATGGAREIVPFELTWLIQCFGWPESVSAQVKKTIEIEGATGIDDTYVLSLGFAKHPAVLVVDVVSRHATRKLTIIGEEAHLTWDWEEPRVNIFDGKSQKWSQETYSLGTAAPGYNQNISENMYIDEVKQFFEACDGKAKFPNTLAEDARVLAILYASEASSKRGSVQWLKAK